MVVYKEGEMKFLIQEENPPEYYDDEPEEDIGVIMKLAVIDCVYESIIEGEVKQ